MSNATKSIILYVDDDTDDCIFLRTSLENAGSQAELVCTHDGEEAVDYLNSIAADCLPSLIVLDLNMPRWDGRTTLQYLKSHPHLANIPVVIFSTSANEKEKEACRQMGAVSYYRKPYRFEDYKAIVAGFISVMNEKDPGFLLFGR
ncbi:MAG TPA: response regulator [Flavisolibacter sp.]|jgi:CheY-like chemotaxis protein|nr:response regulator [Flavisolibacter sp.]